MTVSTRIERVLRLMADPVDVGSERTVLFLQGHPSRFWPRLADAMQNHGHRVLKVHFCLADRLFWGQRPGLNYRGRFAKWADWLDRLLAREKVTDIVYYADRLPYHVVALERARRAGIRVWAIEFGYLRPDWITMEPEGMGRASTFPKSPDAIRALAYGRPAPDMEVKYPHFFTPEAVCEVTFHMVQTLGRPLYPLYNSDKIYWPIHDYLSWIPELVLDRRRERRARELQDRLWAQGTPYNLVAMQIQADYQIRASSPYGGLQDFLHEVMTSFAAHAPKDRHLVIKLHPLDNGIERWFSRVGRLAREFGLADRVHVIKGGDLAGLLHHSRGVVLVNSTVGLHALRQGVPTCVMGDAIFDVEGLTHQAGLDLFWNAPAKVDSDFLDTFIRALSVIQVKGSFFHPAGQTAAIAEICRRIGRRPETTQVEWRDAS